MLGTIVIRVLLVVALLVTAHSIKPFSLKNIAQHIVISTRSFAIVLPEGTREGFDHANLLALSLSKILFDDGFISGMTSAQLLAMRSQQQTLAPAARIWPPDTPVKQGRKSKPPVKRSAPSKRIDKCESNTIAAVNDNVSSPLIALAEAESGFDREAENVLSPVVLPAISEEITNLHTFPLSFLVTQDSRALKMVAALVITENPRPTYELSIKPVPRPKTVAPKCEGQKLHTGEPEMTAPEAEGPKIEELRPEAIEEKKAEPESRPDPLKVLIEN